MKIIRVDGGNPKVVYVPMRPDDPQSQGRQENTRFVELMRSGYIAYLGGKRSLAHDLWRQAATLRPYEEQVWLMLLRVLESEEDRRVCLQNIVAINPRNLQALEQLRRYQQRDAQPVVTGGGAGRARLLRGRLRCVVLRGLEAIILGILLAVLVILLLYAR